jgi:hypothetical protein
MLAESDSESESKGGEKWTIGKYAETASGTFMTIMRTGSAITIIVHILRM